MVKLQVFGNNSKTVNNIKNLTWNKNNQHIKIYPHCNFEANPITHFGAGHNFETRHPSDDSDQVSIVLVLSEEKIIEKVYYDG
jgi:hypothetical protein